MTTWMLDDSDGNWLANLGQDERAARRAAQQIADERDERVRMYRSGSSRGEEFEPTA